MTAGGADGVSTGRCDARVWVCGDPWFGRVVADTIVIAASGGLAAANGNVCEGWTVHGPAFRGLPYYA